MAAQTTNQLEDQKQQWITPALSEIDVARRTQNALVDDVDETLLANNSLMS